MQKRIHVIELVSIDSFWVDPEAEEEDDA